MTDNQLAILIRAQLLAGLTRQGYSTLPVIAAYQPTTEGRVTEATIYFFPLPDNRYGWQHRKRTVDIDAGTITTTEGQWIESGFQFYALAPQDPTNLTLPTAKDLVNLAAMICNSEPFIQGMRAGGAGVQRVTQIRNPFFVNDQGQFESSPSFDIIISHKRSISEVTPVTLDVTCGIYRV